MQIHHSIYPNALDLPYDIFLIFHVSSVTKIPQYYWYGIRLLHIRQYYVQLLYEYNFSIFQSNLSIHLL